MKRAISLLLAALLLALTACGSGGTEDTGGTVQPGVTDNAAAGQVQPGTPEQEEQEEPEDADESAFAPGSVSGGVYTNEFAGIGCTLDDSWVFYTREQMAELNGVLADGADSEDTRAMLSGESDSLDMYAVSTDGLMTINVVFQNLGLLSGATVSVQEYVELAAEKLTETLTGYGYKNVEVQVSAADFAGQKSCPAITVVIDRDGTPLYEQIMCLKAENYIYCVTLCSLTEDVTEQMAALFYGL